jgi:hypothetical protein
MQEPDQIEWRAITIRNGLLTSYGCKRIMGSNSTTHLVSTGFAKSFKIKSKWRSGRRAIPHSSTITTTTITEFNVTGNVIISIEENNSTSNRVKIG